MLTLYTPTLDDLWFRRNLLSDQDTMSYNHAYGGTISFPEEKWSVWHDKWLGANCEKKFYRYLMHKETKEFVGEIAYYLDESQDVYITSIIVHAKYRGLGYGTQGLQLLCKAAKENGIKELFDDIAVDNPSVNLFLQNGFIVEYQTNEIIMVKKEL